MNRMILALMFLLSSVAGADILEDFDSLGGNKVLLEKAKALEPETDVGIVQNRVVPRKFRSEFFPELTQVVGGDSYLATTNYSLNYQFHITERWSAGLRYTHFANELTQQGKDLMSEPINGKIIIPDVDFPLQSYMAIVHWYPIYGKMNIFDQGIVHFDTYVSLGGGQIELDSGESFSYSLGLGLAAWISQHLTARMEVKRQNYTAQRFNGDVEMDLTLLSLSLGYLL